jgi:hypothetical protein
VPGARVTAAQFEALNAGHAMQELDDEALGWFSRRLPWGSYGMLCRASLTSPDLGVAIKRWCRHHRMLTEDITPRAAGGGRRGHRVASPSTARSMRRFASSAWFRQPALPARLHVLGHRFAHFAARGRAFPSRPAAPRRLPADVQRPNCISTRQRASYSFDERYLALPMQRDERALRTMLKRALPLTVLQYRRDRLLGQRVRELLRARASEPGRPARRWPGSCTCRAARCIAS